MAQPIRFVLQWFPRSLYECTQSACVSAVTSASKVVARLHHGAAPCVEGAFSLRVHRASLGIGSQISRLVGVRSEIVEFLAATVVPVQLPLSCAEAADGIH